MNSSSKSTPKTSVETTLASYGTLAPGEVNYNQMDDMEGTWSQGTVRGHRVKAGKGVHTGFPGLILDPEAGEVPVQIFKSNDLPKFWWRLDEFEGEGYLRVPTKVQTKGGEIDAYVYSVKPDFASSGD